jgi:hypothetical protein
MSEPEPLYEEEIEGYTVRFWVEGNWVKVEVVDRDGDSVIGIHRLRTDAEQLLKDPKAREDFAKAAIAALSLFKGYHRYTGWSYMVVRQHKDRLDVRIW